MDDIDYGAVFGVEGGEAQEVAEPEEVKKNKAALARLKSKLAKK